MKNSVSGISRIMTMLMVMLAVLTMSACAPRKIVSPQAEQADAAAQLFEKAERLFKLNQTEKALIAYQHYIDLYPRSSKAPTALLKTGALYLKRGDTLSARRAYDQLIDTFPDSPLVKDAKIDRLHTFYHQERFQEIIRESRSLLNTRLTLSQRIRLLVLEGDAYLSAGKMPEAFSSYFEAAQISKSIQKNEILQKLESVLSLLTPTQIESISTDEMDFKLKGTFFYRTALAHADRGDYHQAFKQLEKFIARYPNHPRHSDATILMQSLKEQQEYDHFSIGCLLPLSGPYQFFGNKALQGIELALHHYSRDSNSQDFNIIIKDTESQPAKAVTAVKELAHEKTAAIIGPITTAREAAVEAENQGIPMISLTQKTDIADIGHFIFQNFLTPRMQVQRLVRYAVEELSLKDFAVFFPDDNYGHIFSSLFQEEVLRRGGMITDIEMYRSDQTDFAEQIKRLVRKPAVSKRNGRSGLVASHAKASVDFQALFIPDAPTKTGLILPQLVYHDITHVQLLGTNLWYSSDLIDMAGPYCQGAILTAGFADNTVSLQNQEFVRNFKSHYQSRPNFIAAVSYDTTRMLLQVMSRKNIHFRSELKDDLLMLKPFQGVTGRTTFKPSGEAEKRPFLLQIRDKDFILLPALPDDLTD